MSIFDEWAASLERLPTPLVIQHDLTTFCIWGHASAIARKVYGNRDFRKKKMTLWQRMGFR